MEKDILPMVSTMPVNMMAGNFFEECLLYRTKIVELIFHVYDNIIEADIGLFGADVRRCPP